MLARISDADSPVAVQLYTTYATPKTPQTLMEAHLQGVALALADVAYHVSWADWGDRLKPFLEDAAEAKSVYDLKFATGVLGRNGVVLSGVSFDVLLAAYLINAGRAGYPLADLAADQVGIELVADPDDPQAGVMDEASAVHALDGALRPRLERDGLAKIFDSIEIPRRPRILAGMERAGVSLDASLLQGVSLTLGTQGSDARSGDL